MFGLIRELAFRERGNRWQGQNDVEDCAMADLKELRDGASWPIWPRPICGCLAPMSLSAPDRREFEWRSSWAKGGACSECP